MQQRTRTTTDRQPCSSAPGGSTSTRSWSSTTPITAATPRTAPPPTPHPQPRSPLQRGRATWRPRGCGRQAALMRCRTTRRKPSSPRRLRMGERGQGGGGGADGEGVSYSSAATPPALGERRCQYIAQLHNCATTCARVKKSRSGEKSVTGTEGARTQHTQVAKRATSHAAMPCLCTTEDSVPITPHSHGMSRLQCQQSQQSAAVSGAMRQLALNTRPNTACPQPPTRRLCAPAPTPAAFSSALCDGPAEAATSRPGSPPGDAARSADPTAGPRAT